MYKCKITPETTPKEEKEQGGKKRVGGKQKMESGGHPGGRSKNLSRYFLLQTQNFWDRSGERRADTHTHTHTLHQIRVTTLKIHTSG